MAASRARNVSMLAFSSPSSIGPLGMYPELYGSAGTQGGALLLPLSARGVQDLAPGLVPYPVRVRDQRQEHGAARKRRLEHSLTIQPPGIRHQP